MESLSNRVFKLILIVCIGCSGLVIGLHWGRLPWASTSWIQVFANQPGLWFGAFLLSIVIAELAWRIVLVVQYRPIPDCEPSLLPQCTVIVPAFNEGVQVYKTLKSLAASDYPKKKLQIIAVDDGSQDDTWAWIQKARQELGKGLKIIRLPRNQGKRHALHAGFLKSTGGVLITVDSDSMVEPLTLKHMVAPFVHDSRVGAVAGNVRVLNRDRGVIPRMLDVAFVYSFDFMRASQSMVNTVMCTPGALSAYRRSVVMEVLSEWLHQKYCGRPANIGEDRAMTNLILRQGKHVLFQQNAMVYTEIPVTYTKLCKMYLRWGRSNVRETIAMSRFAFKRFRNSSMIGARINLLSGWLSLIKSPLFLVTLVMIVPRGGITFGTSIVAGILVFQSLSAGIYAWKYNRYSALWAYMYGIYGFLGLFWIKPYALVTSHRSGWLTRGNPAPKQVHGKPLQAKQASLMPDTTCTCTQPIRLSLSDLSHHPAYSPGVNNYTF